MNSLDKKKILFCVARCKERVSKGLVIEILQGAHSVRVYNKRLNLISSYSSMHGRSTEELEALIQELIEEGLLAESPDEFPHLMLTDESHKLLHEHADELTGEASHWE